MKTIEYRVRPVTRYVVTRFEGFPAPLESKGSCTTKGEFENHATAYSVAYALCKEEHERLGYPAGDERIQYPDNRTPKEA